MSSPKQNRQRKKSVSYYRIETTIGFLYSTEIYTNGSDNERIHVLYETEFTKDEKAYLFESRFPKAKGNPYK